MFKGLLSWKNVLASLGVTGLLITGVPLLSFAQSGSGLTIFSGVSRDNLLDHFLDFSGQKNNRDRYRLRIPGKKLTQGASKFYIFYPDYFDGKFNVDLNPDKKPKKNPVRVSIGEGKKKRYLPIREVIWDKENYLLEIELDEPLQESRKVELVFSGVKNPDVGTYYFRCEVLPAADLPIRQYIGTWIIGINP